MTYLEKFEEEFLKKLQACGDDLDLARWVSEKLLESYRQCSSCR